MTGGAVWCALLAAGAVWLALPGQPPGRPGVEPRRRLPAGLAPRPDALATPMRLAIAGLVSAALGMVLPAAFGLVAAGLGFGVLAVLLGRVEAPGHRATRLAVARELPETLDLLASALEAGAPLRSAVTEVARAGPPACARVLRGVEARVGVGVGDGEAWAALWHDPSWGAVAKDLSRSAETGAAAAGLLRLHAEEARQRRRDEQLKRARAVGVRSTVPLMTCFLPAFLLVGVAPIVAGLVHEVFGG